MQEVELPEKTSKVLLHPLTIRGNIVGLGLPSGDLIWKAAKTSDLAP